MNAEPAAARAPVLVGTLSCAAMIAQHVGGKSARDALFLSTFDVSKLPAAMIAASFVSLAAAYLVSRAIARRSPARAVPWLFAAASASYAAEFAVSLTAPRAAAVLVFAHLAIFGATSISAFWSIVSESFDPHSAKRAVARIASGGALGGVVGGLVGWLAAPRIGAQGMLLALAVANALAAVGTKAMGATHVAHRAERSAPAGALRELSNTPYLRHLAFFVLLGAILQALLDFQLSARAAGHYTDRSQLLAFFALFHTGIAALSFLTQATASRWILERLGLAATVAFLPTTTAVASIVAAIVPGFGPTVVARGAEGVFRSSLHRAGYELFYTPLSPAKKRSVKTLIDVGFDRIGAAAGSAGALACVVGLARPMAERGVLGLTALAGIAAALLCARLHRGYLRALEESIRTGTVDLSELEVLDRTTRRALERAGGDAREMLASKIAAHRERDDDATHSIDALVADLADDAHAPAAILSLRAIGAPVVAHLAEALLDPSRPVTVRKRIPRVLEALRDDPAVDALVRGLEDPSLEIRESCVTALLDHPPPEGPRRDRIASLALAELEREPALDGEPTAARARRVAHVLALLTLVHDREPMRLAHRAWRGGEGSLRGTALEYLDVVLPAEVKEKLWPHLLAELSHRQDAR